MRVKKNGTSIHCPYCKKVTVCKAVPPSSLGEQSGQRWYKKNHQDVQWFRRGRTCLTCDKSFLTSELDEDFIDELCKLRDALGVIKANAELYISESDKASETLRTLSRSLEVLRALDVYKRQA